MTQRLSLPDRGRYFLRLTSVTTRVITAQSIITKVNKSLYVTIGTSSLQSIRQLAYRPFGSLGKYIILSMWLPPVLIGQFFYNPKSCFFFELNSSSVIITFLINQLIFLVHLCIRNYYILRLYSLRMKFTRCLMFLFNCSSAFFTILH